MWEEGWSRPDWGWVPLATPPLAEQVSAQVRGPLSRSSVLTKRFFSEASLIAPIHSWVLGVWRGTFVAIWFVLLFSVLLSPDCFNWHTAPVWLELSHCSSRTELKKPNTFLPFDFFSPCFLEFTVAHLDGARTKRVRTGFPWTKSKICISRRGKKVNSMPGGATSFQENLVSVACSEASWRQQGTALAPSSTSTAMREEPGIKPGIASTLESLSRLVSDALMD